MNLKKIVKAIVLIFISQMHTFTANGNGPNQPEYSNFKSANMNEMVNEFSGSFSYSIPVLEIPGPNGSGYSLTLSYQSGIRPDDESSWVGLGWTLNPGAINRIANGFPDDYYEQPIIYWNKTKPAVSAKRTETFDMEAWSSSPLNINFDNSVEINNYFGLRSAFGAKISAKDLKFVSEYLPFKNVSLSFRRAESGMLTSNFTFDLFPQDILSSFGFDNFVKKCEEFTSDISNFSKKYLLEGPKNFGNIGFLISDYIYCPTSTKGFNIPKWETQTNVYKGEITFKPSFIQLGLDMGIGFEYNVSENIDNEKILNSWGYMYSGDCIKDDDLMDYFVENESDFQMRDNFLGCPFSNPDEFIVSGENIQGGFKLINNNIGHFRPNQINCTKTFIDVSANLNFGGDWGFGFQVPMNLGYTKISGFDDDAIRNYKFLASNDDKDPFFFRFNNDLGGSVNFGFNPVSNDIFKPVSFDLPFYIPIINIGALLGLEFNDNNFQERVHSSLSRRPGCSSNISYRTFEDITQDYLLNYIHHNKQKSINLDGPSIQNRLLVLADHKSGIISLGLDNQSIDINNLTNLRSLIKITNTDSKEIDIGKLIREFTITNKSGEIYVYGQPVFSRDERTLSYGIKAHLMTPLSNDHDSLIISRRCTPAIGEFQTLNGFEKIVPYASTYLLTEIFSPDYIDRLNDGPTDDDFGGYTKFSYSKTAGSNILINPNNYRWMESNWQTTNSEPKQINSQYCTLPDLSSVKLLNTNDLQEDSEWYKWRKPYKGLNYSQNSISDPADDVASVTMGEKEIYYLDSIETKTHIAYFVKNISHFDLKLSNANNGYNIYCLSGSGEERLDGMEAAHNEYFASGSADFSADNFNSDHKNKLRKLEKIVLCAKDINHPGRISKIIRTTYFDYDYSLQHNNNNSKTNLICSTKGKLTLRKVWFEDEDVKEKKISPYEFSYIYDDFSANLPQIYSTNTSIGNYGNGLSTAVQNPDYSDYQSDAWGYNRLVSDGYDNIKNYINSVNQIPTSPFDPAAYNLKKIHLPSGGDIHIQYEQNDYNYVQNRKSMVLAKFIDSANTDKPKLNPIIKVDLSQIFPNFSSFTELEKTEYCNLLKNYFAKQRLFFKFNYNLFDPKSICSTNYQTDIYNNTPYIKDIFRGYADVETGTININIYTNILSLKLVGPTENIPYNLAAEFKNTQRIGYVKDNLTGTTVHDIYNSSFNLSLILNLINVFSTTASEFCSLFPEIGLDETNPGYIKLPTPIGCPKKGGGIRVKRLVTVDKLDQRRFNPNASSSDKYDKYSVCGKEYLYVDAQGHSSGVASNEPTTLHEENALTEFFSTKDDFNKVEKFLGYHDYSYSEKPIGKNLLPSASVGYSRVVSKEIFEGITDPGFVISEFNSTKDYPYDFDTVYTSKVDNHKEEINSYCHTNINKRLEDPPVKPSWFTWEGTYVSQGYQFLLNSLNGQKKSIKSYAGKFDNNDTWVNTTSVIYDYFSPGERVPVLYQPDNLTCNRNNEFTIKEEYPGLDMEIVCEDKKIEDFTGGISIRNDYDIGFTIIPIFLPALYVYPTTSYTVAKSHVTNRVIRYPSILKRVTKTQEGLTTVSENVAFDRYSGDPVITRTADGFDNLALIKKQRNKTDNGLQDGSYYSYNFLASNQYPGMSQKAINEGMKLVPVSKNCIISYNPSLLNNYAWLEIKNNEPCGDLYKQYDLLETGDLIKLTSISTSDGFIGYFYVDRNNYYLGSGKDIRNITLKPFNIWDKNPNPSQNINLQVIKSGRNNKLTSSSGSILTYGNTSKMLDCGVKIPTLPDFCDFSSHGEPTLMKISRNKLTEDLNSILRLLSPDILSRNFANPISILEPNTNDSSMSLILLNKGKLDTIIGLKNIGIEISAIPYSNSDSIIINLNVDQKVLIHDKINIYSIDSSNNNHHPLAEDLNQWLNNTWKENIKLTLGTIRNFDSCYAEGGCDTITSSTNQKYKSFGSHRKWGLCGDKSYCDDGLNKLVDEITGMNTILQKNYFINGKILKGQDIIDPNPCDTFGHFQKYFFTVKKNDSISLTYLSRNEIRFKDNQDIGWMGIRRQVQRYSPACQRTSPLPPGLQTDSVAGQCMKCDCSNYLWFADQGNNYNNNWYKAWIDLPLGNSANNPGYKEFNSESNPDQNNDEMYMYMMLEDTVKFTEKFGKFQVSNDGWLEYKPLDVGSNKCYNNDQPVKIIKLQDNPLVSDLNRWLNNVWSFNLAKKLPFERNWGFCDDDIDSSKTSCSLTLTSQNHKFINMGFCDVWPGNHQSYFDDKGLNSKVDSLTGLSQILRNFYFIDGTYKSGSDIIQANPIDTNGDGQKYYFVHKNNSWDSISAFISKSEIKFKNNPSIWMGIRRQFQRYGTFCNGSDTCSNPINCQYSDCSNYPYFCNQKGIYSTNWYKAWIDLPMGDSVTNDGYKEFIEFSDPDSNNLQMLSYMKLNSNFTNTIGKFDIDSLGWLIYKPLLSIQSGGIYTNLNDVRILRLYDSTKTYDSVITTKFLASKNDIQNYFADTNRTNPNNFLFHGPFFIDPVNDGQILFGYNNNDNVRLTAITFPADINDNISDEETIQKSYCMFNVIKANAELFCGGNWDFSFENAETHTYYLNPVSEGSFGIFRPYKSYIYNTDNIYPGAGDAATDRIYLNSGVIINNIHLLGWKDPDAILNEDKNWLFENEITKYSSGGDATEQKNVLEIYSTQKYSYNNSLPYLVGQNAEFPIIGFESFEDRKNYPINLVDFVSTDYAHTGKYSLCLHDTFINFSRNTYVVLELKNLGKKSYGPTDYIVKLWVKECDLQTDNPILLSITNGIGGTYSPNQFSKIAQTGEWSLFQAIFNAVQIPLYGTMSLSVQNNRGLIHNYDYGVLSKIYIDDIRLQPIESEMMAYIYDEATLKPSAILDDQNFALIYLYDYEGNLVRQKRETQNGFLTISEVQTNTPLVLRNHIPSPLIISNNQNNGNKFNANINKKYNYNVPNRLPVREGIVTQHPGMKIKSNLLDVKITPKKIDVNVLKDILPDSSDNIKSTLNQSKEQILEVIPTKGFMDSTSKRYKLKDNMDFNNKLLTDSLNPELNNLNKYEQNISNPDSLSNNNQHMFKIDTNIQKQLKDSIDNEYNKEIKQEQNYKFKK